MLRPRGGRRGRGVGVEGGGGQGGWAAGSHVCRTVPHAHARRPPKPTPGRRPHRRRRRLSRRRVSGPDWGGRSCLGGWRRRGRRWRWPDHARPARRPVGLARPTALLTPGAPSPGGRLHAHPGRRHLCDAGGAEALCQLRRRRQKHGRRRGRQRRGRRRRRGGRRRRTRSGRRPAGAPTGRPAPGRPRARFPIPRLPLPTRAGRQRAAWHGGRRGRPRGAGLEMAGRLATPDGGAPRRR